MKGLRDFLLAPPGADGDGAVSLGGGARAARRGGLGRVRHDDVRRRSRAARGVPGKGVSGSGLAGALAGFLVRRPEASAAGVGFLVRRETDTPEAGRVVRPEANPPEAGRVVRPEADPPEAGLVVRLEADPPEARFLVRPEANRPEARFPAGHKAGAPEAGFPVLPDTDSPDAGLFVSPEPPVSDAGLPVAPEAAAADERAEPGPLSAAETSVGARSLAVLCAAEDARAIAVAAGALLARRSRAVCGLACVWTAPEPSRHPEARAPATRAARRLAGSLSARGLDALACGRAAVVALPSDPAEAVTCAGRAAAASGTAPAVLVLGGPRAAAFDDLLAGQDRVLVVTRPGAAGAVAALALAGLPAAAPPHATCVVGLGPVGRALAAGGLAVPAALRRALDAGEERGR